MRRRLEDRGAILLLAIAACEHRQPNAAASSAVLADSMGVAPTNVETIRLRGYDDLVENSAAAMSTTQPGIWFTVNDSGSEPVLFAFDTTGAPRGWWRIAGARNTDWESASAGPCGPPDVSPLTRPDRSECVYIGDTGDNDAAHKSRSIYRVNEPSARSGRDALNRDTLPAFMLTYRYADGPHDVEAMYVAPDRAIYLITKRPLAGAHGRLRDALVFRLAPKAWTSPGLATAELVDSLPIVPGSAPGREVTDAALSPDAKFLAARTYMQVYVFAIDSTTGRILRHQPLKVCNVVSLDEPQGEGITWMSGSRRLLFTTEGRGASIRIATCPLDAR